ncbi:SWIB/MDM2 domain containing protein [Citrus sinensis]|uniref:SWIB/MDM2 domain containing protein n=1 Tax=Citrus sinensis TaxID=2711 RepID=A0ACB8J2G6_CITSI|nr:SWIB/MDM2 domain containing protein [Citrus sinensis]
MVSDSELIARLQEFLKNSDLNTTTTGIVRRQLEKDFGVDLTDKKIFIREQVDLFLQSQFENDQNDGGNEEQQEEDDGEDDQMAKVKSDETDGSDDAAVEEGDDDNNDENDNDDEANEAKGPAKRRSRKLNNEVKKRGGGFSKLCALSPQLQEFIGVTELARTEVVKQLWAYIREKDLQDPNNRRNIVCDERLRALFGVDTINMFQMNKALSKHIWPLDSDDASTVSDLDEPTRKEKRQKGGKSGFLAPLQLSDALIKFLGTGESALPRSDVIKRMWDYIKEKNLQDPSDKRRIICDEKLKELFDVDTFNGFTVTKLLVVHFLKT